LDGIEYNFRIEERLLENIDLANDIYMVREQAG